MDTTRIRYDVHDGVATITLARPDLLNVFDVPMMREMIAALDEVDADDAVRAVVVTGDGRAFCAGADLSAGGDSFDYETVASAAKVRSSRSSSRRSNGSDGRAATASCVTAAGFWRCESSAAASP